MLPVLFVLPVVDFVHKIALKLYFPQLKLTSQLDDVFCTMFVSDCCQFENAGLLSWSVSTSHLFVLTMTSESLAMATTLFAGLRSDYNVSVVGWIILLWLGIVGFLFLWLSVFVVFVMSPHLVSSKHFLMGFYLSMVLNWCSYGCIFFWWVCSSFYSSMLIQLWILYANRTIVCIVETKTKVWIILSECLGVKKTDHLYR